MNIETLFRIVASVSGTGAVKEFTADIKKISTNADLARRSMKMAGQVAATAFAGLSLYKFVGDLKEVANYMDDMSDAADRVGVSTRAFSTLAYQAKVAEVPVADLERGLKNMQVTLSNISKTGSSEALSEIGLKIEDIRKLEADKQFAEIADGINKVGDASDRARLRQEFFGKSGGKLNDLMKLSKERMAELAAEAERLGVVIDESGAQKAEKFKESMVRLDSAYQGFIIRLAENGTLEQLGNLFVWLAEKVAAATGAIANFGSNIGMIANANSIMALESKVQGIQIEKARYQEILKDPSKSGRFQLGIDDEAETRVRAIKKLDELTKEWAAAQDEFKSLKGDLIAGGVNPSQLGIPTGGGSGAGGAPKVDKPTFSKNVADADKSVSKYTESVKKLNQEQDKTFGSAASKAFDTWAENGENAADKMENVFFNVFQGLEDSIEKFVTTGKLSFRDLAASVISDLIRIQIQTSITKPLFGMVSSIFGSFMGGGVDAAPSTDTIGGGGGGLANQFAMGGIMTSGGQLRLRKYATGGIADSPQLALFGEGRMPEAYVPLPDGRRIPVALSGSNGAGGGIMVNINVDMAGGSSVESNEAEGFAVGEAFKAAVVEVIVKQKLPGGVLNRNAIGA